MLPGDLHQDLALARAVAARLLHVDVLARLGREDRHRGVPVVRRRDQQRVHVLVFQHAAEIGLLLRCPALRLLGDRGGGREIAAIRVDHVLELDAGQRRELVDQLDAAPAAAGRAGAHAGDGEHHLVAGRRRPRRRTRHQGDGRPGGDGGADELAAGDLVLHEPDTTGIPGRGGDLRASSRGRPRACENHRLEDQDPVPEAPPGGRRPSTASPPAPSRRPSPSSASSRGGSSRRGRSTSPRATTRTPTSPRTPRSSGPRSGSPGTPSTATGPRWGGWT